MEKEKLVNIGLSESDLQNILNWHTLSAIHYEVTKEEEDLRTKLWTRYKKEFDKK